MSIAMVMGTLPICAATADTPDAARVSFQWSVKIPMRDGVELNASLYTPKEQQSPAPCIFTLTPYIAQRYHDQALYFAARGFPFLTVDVRGRGNSAGEFRPFLQEAQDGYDVTEWIAKQSYCNGKVGMWGGSYGGYDQWATAKALPPHLATIAPVASVFPGRDFPMRNNIPYPYVMRWLTFTSGRALQLEMFGDRNFWLAKDREWLESGRPFKELDVIVGNPSPQFQEWVAHPTIDAFWDSYVPNEEQYAKMQMPILTITGSYDGDQIGALLYYRAHMQHGASHVRAQHYLVIGPWDHAGTRNPNRSVGGLKFGTPSLVDLKKLHLQWYAWAMQEGPKPEFLRKPVAYYVTGADRWRYADTLDAVTARSESFFLDSTNNATSVFDSGSLNSQVQPTGKPDRYIYDPREPVRFPAGEEGDTYLTNQQRVLTATGKQFVYHTAAFAEDTEISGSFKLQLWLSIDQPDTDLQASVYEIEEGGSSILLATDIQRTRYREGLRQAKLIKPGEINRYDFNSFTFISRQVKRGSRLRLAIDSINSINRQRNYNSGGTVAEESIEDARPVTVTLFHDRKHPSALWVPFGHPPQSNELAPPSSTFAME